MGTFEGKLIGKGFSFAIIVSRFNDLVTKRLLDGALDCLQRHNVDKDNIDVYYVPGVWEVPCLANHIIKSRKKRYSAIICLGAVIRGQTPHFEYVASESAKGVSQVALANDAILAYGIVTADSLEQALDRSGAKTGNKGYDAAQTALEMVNLFNEIK